MRRLFAKKLFEYMEKDDKIYLLTGDLGYNLFEKIRSNFPSRFINCGASEQAMLDVAVGLALDDKIPFVYSITTFLLYRPFEAIRNYLNHEKIPVKLIGSGRDLDYKQSGITHCSEDDTEVMKLFPMINSYWPSIKNLPYLLDRIVHDKKPTYINLSK